LIEEKHFGKAADRLFISQPALSKQIKLLESKLGFNLITREKKTFVPTAAGLFVYKEAKYILNHINLTVLQAQDISKGNKGIIRIGFVGSAMQKLLPETILHLTNNYPRIHTSLEELNNLQQINLLIHDELDVGFIRMRNVPLELEVLAVQTDTFSLVLPVKYGNTNINWERLSKENFILFSPEYSPEYYDTVISICQDHGFEPIITHKTVHANTIFRLVENGMGISIVPTILTKGFDLNIVFHPLEEVPQRTTLYMVTKRNNRNPALSHFKYLFTSSKKKK
jgi:DNA-binding transcriptional LysR family regulator